MSPGQLCGFLTKALCATSLCGIAAEVPPPEPKESCLSDNSSFAPLAVEAAVRGAEAEENRKSPLTTAQTGVRSGSTERDHFKVLPSGIKPAHSK